MTGVEQNILILKGFCFVFVVWPAILISFWMWNVRLAKRRIGSWSVDRTLYFIFSAGHFGAQVKESTNKFIRLDDDEWMIFRQYQIYFQLEVFAVGMLIFILLTFVK